MICVSRASGRQRRQGFIPDVERITMIVESVAQDYLMDDEVIPTLPDRRRDYKNLKKRKIVVIPGNMELFATATGTM